jgi:hypothetical protein
MRTKYMLDDRQLISERLGIALLVLSYVVICCVSSLYVSSVFYMFRLAYDPARVFSAGVAVAVFAPVALLFAFARFSFGYFTGFYFLSMIVGYIWLSFFSSHSYDRQPALLSAAVSAVVFLLPALFITSPIRQIVAMSLRTFDRLLMLIFLLCLVTAAVGASYNFHFADVEEVSDLRTDAFPAILKYLITITSSSMLPFLFASFLARRNLWGAGTVLLLLLFYYPIVLSKVAFFAPAWLVVMALSARVCGAKITVILSLLIPAMIGVILIFLLNRQVLLYETAMFYFRIVNFRMMAIPSIAMDVYSDFFSKHQLTYFCQMWVLKPFIGCAYQDPLSILMSKNYPFGGNFNASLFATEGVASVGFLLAPLSAFAAGLVIALGNRLSAGLPPSFILVSGAIVAQVLLNIPLSTVLLTHGAGFLFLLWYITPRGMFEQEHEGKQALQPSPRRRSLG